MYASVSVPCTTWRAARRGRGLLGNFDYVGFSRADARVARAPQMRRMRRGCGAAGARAGPTRGALFCTSPCAAVQQPASARVPTVGTTTIILVIVNLTFYTCIAPFPQRAGSSQKQWRVTDAMCTFTTMAQPKSSRTCCMGWPLSGWPAGLAPAPRPAGSPACCLARPRTRNLSMRLAAHACSAVECPAVGWQHTHGKRQRGAWTAHQSVGVSRRTAPLKP